MKLRNHVLVALGIAVLVAPLDPWRLGYAAIMTSLGSLVPDLDLGWGHRKYLHNVFAVLALYTVILVATGREYMAFLMSLGMLSHIATDTLTSRGVALLWPISRKFYSLTKLRYDSRVFDVFAALVFAAAVIARLLYLKHGGADSLPLLNPSPLPEVVMREPQI